MKDQEQCTMCETCSWEHYQYAGVCEHNTSNGPDENGQCGEFEPKTKQ